MNNNSWYLDYGYFRHMLGDKSQFKKFESLSGGSVTFENRSTTMIKGKINIDIPNLPTFHNILIVNSLKANLLSISQFYYKNHSV
jgi:hypothetical protein